MVPGMSNLGHVSDNVSEQTMSAALELRGFGPIDAILAFINMTVETVAARRLKVVSWIKEGYHVVPAVMEKIRYVSHDWSKRWTATIVKVTNNTISAGVIHNESGFALRVQITTERDPTLQFWYDYASCSCGYTRSRGYPCPHVALVILHGPGLLNSFYRNKSVSASARPKDLVLTLNQPLYYESTYHTSSLEHLYAVEQFVPEGIDKSSFKLHKLMPWNCSLGAASAQRKRKRHTSGKHLKLKPETGQHGGAGKRLRALQRESTEFELSSLAFREVQTMEGPFTNLRETAASENETAASERETQQFIAGFVEEVGYMDEKEEQYLAGLPGSSSSSSSSSAPPAVLNVVAAASLIAAQGMLKKTRACT